MNKTASRLGRFRISTLICVTGLAAVGFAVGWYSFPYVFYQNASLEFVNCQCRLSADANGDKVLTIAGEICNTSDSAVRLSTNGHGLCRYAIATNFEIVQRIYLETVHDQRASSGCNVTRLEAGKSFYFKNAITVDQHYNAIGISVPFRMGGTRQAFATSDPISVQAE